MNPVGNVKKQIFDVGKKQQHQQKAFLGARTQKIWLPIDSCVKEANDGALPATEWLLGSFDLTSDKVQLINEKCM